tara:strand:- start:2845 stop:3075 length:231 start_codon:yes stop_codon:yes gene_type:complete
MQRNSIDITKYDEETQKAIEWVRLYWGAISGGSGTAYRRDKLRESYGQILRDNNLEPYLVEDGGYWWSRYDVRVIA